MQNKLIRIASIVIGLALFSSAALPSEPPPITASVISSINLPVPQGPEDKTYLGLAGDGLFDISQVKAEVVIIEIFSMYCPRCQGEAPRVNELYRLITKDSDLKGKIKMIGIGAGNSPFEVEIFRKTYGVPFPLFPDEDFSIHKKLGEVRTPYFIGVKIKADGSLAVFYSKLGGFQDPHQFLKLMLQRSGLKEG